MIYLAMLVLLGPALLVYGKNFLDNYEKKQEDFYASVTDVPTPTPRPTATPIVKIIEKYRFTYTFPLSFTVTCENLDPANNETITEKVTDTEGISKKEVTIETYSKDLVLKITDAYGNNAEFRPGDTLVTGNYTLVLPDNFEVTVPGISENEEIPESTGIYLDETSDNPDLLEIGKYADVPKLLTYTFSDALYAPNIKIFDNNGNEIVCEWEENCFKVTKPYALQELPENISLTRTVESDVKALSDFMTDDLGATYYFKDSDGNKIPYTEGMTTKGLTYYISHPADHGFSLLKDILLKDTYYYEKMYEYAYGPDIKLTSKHKPVTELEDLQITNFIVYSDDVFTCDVSFVRELDLWSTTNSKWYKTVRDETNERLWYVRKQDESGNYTWYAADAETITGTN